MFVVEKERALLMPINIKSEEDVNQAQSTTERERERERDVLLENHVK